MADVLDLEAEPRERLGKGAARAERRRKRVPAVIYGGKGEPQHVHLPFNAIAKEMNQGRISNTLYALNIKGKKVRVVTRDLQVDPVKDMPVHIDFQRVSDKTMIPVEVEVRFRDEDECPGLVRGGFLEYVRYQVELLVPAGSIPDYIEASLKGRDINDTIHISDFDLPEGVEPTITDRDFTVATITAPSGMAEDEEEGEPEEPAEPEVIRQKDEDEDQGEA